MATLEQMERALVNADRAGDTAAARQLAVAIKAARNGQMRLPTPKRSPVEQGVADRAGISSNPMGSVAQGLTNKLGQAFTFGLADEAAGVGAAAGNVLGVVGNRIARGLGADIPETPFDPVGRYDAARRQHMGAIDRAEREAPAAADLATIAGVAGNVALPAVGMIGKGLMGAVKAGTKAGAVGGGLAGFGNADGGLANRGSAGVLGGATGAALGAAIPVAAQGVGSAFRAGQRLTGRGPSVSPQLVAEALQADGGIGRARRAVEAAQARGVPMALADTGDNARGVLASVGRQPGPARTIVRDMAIGRQEGQIERLAGAVNRDLGPTGSVMQQSEALRQRAKAAAAPLYEAAYNAPIAITDDLSGILKRMPPQAVENAKAIARLEGRNPNTMGVDLNEAGEVVLTQRPTMQTLDYIKRGMDDVVETFRDGTSGRLNLDTRGRATNDLLRDFVSEIDRINPAYREARAAYAGPTKMAGALEKGAKALNADADRLIAMTRDLTPGEMEQFRLGFRSALVTSMEGRGDYADKVRQIVGQPKKRAALQRLFGGKAEFDRFMSTVADEAELAKTYQSVAGNSLTAERQAFDSATGDSGLLATAAGSVTDAARGNFVGAITRVLGELRNYGAGEAGKRVRSEVAAAMSETDPAILRQALAKALKAQRGEAARLRGVGRSGVRQGRAAGLTAGSVIGYASRPEE